MHSTRVAKQGMTQDKRKQVLGTKKVPNVLVVEDNLMNQKIASCFLNRAEMPHRLACNGREALNIITQGEVFDVVLMDCMMPVMDGLTATKHIRQWENDNQRVRLPIVALTARELPEEVNSCFNAGMDAYLSKPYKLEQLLETFRKLEVIHIAD